MSNQEQCSLTKLDNLDFDTTAGDMQLVWDTGIPEECYTCIHNAPKLGKTCEEFDNGEPNYEDYSETGFPRNRWATAGIAIRQGTSLRIFVEEFGFEWLDGVNEGVDTRISTQFNCIKQEGN